MIKFERNWPLAGIPYARSAIYSIASAACVACSSLPQTVSVDFAEPDAVPTITAVPRPPATNGSLFQKASYRPSFEDVRARAIGDTVTIQIVERVTASQVSSSKANRTTSGSGSGTGVGTIS